MAIRHVTPARLYGCAHRKGWNRKIECDYVQEDRKVSPALIIAGAAVLPMDPSPPCSDQCFPRLRGLSRHRIPPLMASGHAATVRARSRSALWVKAPCPGGGARSKAGGTEDGKLAGGGDGGSCREARPSGTTMVLSVSGHIA